MSEHIKSKSFHKNVIDTSGDSEDVVNGYYFSRFFESLKHEMGDSFNEWNFVVHQRKQGEKKGVVLDFPRGDARTVLFLLSDERERFPMDDYPAYARVFRSYLRHERTGSREMPFPIGFQDTVGHTEAIPYLNRTIPVFFSGNLNRNRIDLFRQFCPIPMLPKSNLKSRISMELTRRLVKRLIPERNFSDSIPGSTLSFTAGFMQGLPQDHYAKTLANTRIAICPPGFASNETIRHWEAMKMGCIIITSPLPPNRFYRGNPMIVLQNWADLMPVLESLLQDPAEMMQRHLATSEWWDKICCEKAVAKHVANCLSGRTS